MFQGRFHQVLGLRARDQNIRRHAEIAAVKFLAAGDVLRRLALQALVQIAAVVNPPYFAQFFVGMRVETCAIAAERVGEQDFGGQARGGDRRVFEKLLCLAEERSGGSSRHGRALRGFALSFSFSVW